MRRSSVKEAQTANAIQPVEATNNRCLSILPTDIRFYTGAVLEVNGLGKRFDDRWIFRGLSFSLSVGDKLVVRGRNGAGKSTLLKVLAHLLMPSEGSLEGPPGDPRLNLSLSALDQALYPHLTVREHLILASDLRGCPARTEELLVRIGLVEAGDRFAALLSTGMRSRLRLALAIQPEPALLLLDEPGASLDEDGRTLVASICDEQGQRGCLILATNDPEERRLANLELNLVD